MKATASERHRHAAFERHARDHIQLPSDRRATHGRYPRVSESGVTSSSIAFPFVAANSQWKSIYSPNGHPHFKQPASAVAQTSMNGRLDELICLPFSHQ